MPMVLASTFLPPWLVLPAAAAVMLTIAWHVAKLQESPIPASRRRIRTANGFVMLLTTAMLAYAFGSLHGSDPKRFVLVWATIVALVGLMIVLAAVDAVNTVRLGASERRSLRATMRDGVRADLTDRTRGDPR